MPPECALRKRVPDSLRWARSETSILADPERVFSPACHLLSSEKAQNPTRMPFLVSVLWILPSLGAQLTPSRAPWSAMPWHLQACSLGDCFVHAHGLSASSLAMQGCRMALILFYRRKLLTLSMFLSLCRVKVANH